MPLFPSFRPLGSVWITPTGRSPALIVSAPVGSKCFPVFVPARSSLRRFMSKTHLLNGSEFYGCRLWRGAKIISEMFLCGPIVSNECGEVLVVTATVWMQFHHALARGVLHRFVELGKLMLVIPPEIVAVTIRHVELA
jgi:hypothetical protein